MRTPIEMNAFTAKLGEGAAVRLGKAVTQTEGETHIYFEPQEQAKAVVLSDAYVEDAGRTLDVSMTLKDVHPGRRATVGLALSEVDDGGAEHMRGFRAITVPAHTCAQCSDLAMPSTRFIVPDKANEEEGGAAEDARIPDTGCACEASCRCGGRRHFVMRTTTHYMD